MSPKKFVPAVPYEENMQALFYTLFDWKLIQQSISDSNTRIPPLESNAFWVVVELTPVFNTLANGLAPLSCNRSADPLGFSFCFGGAADAAGVGSGIPNKSRILGVAFEETGAVVPLLSGAEENGLANGFDAFCCSYLHEKVEYDKFHSILILYPRDGSKT